MPRELTPPPEGARDSRAAKPGQVALGAALALLALVWALGPFGMGIAAVLMIGVGLAVRPSSPAIGRGLLVAGLVLLLATAAMFLTLWPSGGLESGIEVGR